MQMTFSALENSLLHEVMRRPQPLSQLLATATTRYGISRAGFYKALAALKHQEVLVGHDHILSVNKLWLLEAYAFFESLVERKRTPGYLAREVAGLGSGEELTYTFRSITDIDLFLINLVYDLLLLKQGTEVLLEESHEFFLLLNQVRTDTLLKDMQRDGYGLYLLITSTSPIDSIITKENLTTPGQGYVTGRGRTSRKVLHAVGDVIIELQLHIEFARELEKLYTTHEKVTDALRNKVEALVAKNYKHRIRIVKDATLAARMRTRFKKYFALK